MAPARTDAYPTAGYDALTFTVWITPALMPPL